MSISVSNISKYYGTQKALNNVSIEVASGEIVGFLGPNGAGKSTLMKIITGYIPANLGTANICGMLVDAYATKFRSKIGYLPEHNPLYPEMYIREYLGIVAGFYRLNNKKEKVEKVIEITGLTPEAHKKIGALSKGYRQRVGLAQALIHDPEVLILDEPTSGLDPNQLNDIRNLITGISTNKTVLLSTHIMQEVEAICNRVIIINNGSIIADGSTQRIKEMSLGLGQQVELATLEPLDTKYLTELSFVASVKLETANRCIITSATEADIRPMLFKMAVEKKLTIISLYEQSRTIENVFRDLTR
ncbi:MAG: gliding motility-associated ABC transporter ATP-binding subunit GldA [Prolixibacteraceae bacterium]|nr:gliding motility-associated ABC transporter ATP-binding subunit GldA [Prolixibacteraceae bacterium]